MELSPKFTSKGTVARTLNYRLIRAYDRAQEGTKNHLIIKILLEEKCLLFSNEIDSKWLIGCNSIQFIYSFLRTKKPI